MRGRLNERNTGGWSINSEPKHLIGIPKKISKSFSSSEIEMMQYLLKQVAESLVLDSSDLNNQFFTDNGNLHVRFDREKIEDIWTLVAKFVK